MLAEMAESSAATKPITTSAGKRIFERTIGSKKYTVSIPKAWRDDHVLLHLFGQSKPGEARFYLWKAWMQEHWPEPVYVWSRWDDLVFAACCGYAEKIEEITGQKIEADYDWWKRIIMTGAASSGKSLRCAVWILGNWSVEQVYTSCILTSTSLEQLKRRIWAELTDMIGKSKYGFRDIMEVVASDTVIRMNNKDTGDLISTRSAIFGRAVDQGGSLEAAKDRIKGIHNRRIFVVADEFTAMPEALATACRNLETGTLEFQFFGLGNATSKEDQHGIYAEPLHGWNTVSVEDEFWLTAKGGCCVHLDGFKSPALKEPDKYPFYISQQKIDDDIRFHGGEHNPHFWIEVRGFWPESGLSNTVMDDQLLQQFNVSEKATWRAGYTMCGAFDPAFEGGDRRILYPFKLGDYLDGTKGIEFQEPIIVSVDMTQDKRFLHYQIADAVQAECENYQCDGRKQPIAPADFMMDTSGEAGGLFSIMSGRWSPSILPCEFGGAADKDQMFPDRPVTWYETYANRVSMLWYVFRRYIEGGQVRGLRDPETRSELTGRQKEDKLRNGKIAIQPKSKMKGMKHRSPDKADACVIAAELLRRRGVVFAGAKGGSQLADPSVWNEWASQTTLEETNEDYADDNSAFASI
jgi:hypothetical protein